MKNTITTGILALAIITMSSVLAFAEPIEGTWKTQAGENAMISKCGGSYCIKVTSGKHAGKNIGKMKGSGNSYNGTITDPADDKQYSGSIKIKGASMKLKGCAMKIFCKTQNWKKL